MLSTRKDEVKTTLLTFFPKVLTTIIADYQAGPDLSQLDEFIKSRSNAPQDYAKSMAAAQYYIAQALLTVIEKTPEDLNNIKMAIESCYHQNQLVATAHNPRDHAESSVEACVKKINAYCTEHHSPATSIPSVMYKTTHFTLFGQSSATNYYHDVFHNVLVNLYTQCGGKVVDNKAPKNASDKTAYQMSTPIR